MKDPDVIAQELDTLIAAEDAEGLAALDHELVQQLTKAQACDVDDVVRQIRAVLSSFTRLSKIFENHLKRGPDITQTVWKIWPRNEGTDEWRPMVAHPEPSWDRQLVYHEGRHLGFPQSLADLVALVKAVPPGESMDVLGAGVSTNGLFATSASHLLLTMGLQRQLDFEEGLYRGDPRAEHWYRTEAGVRVYKLCDDMWEAGVQLDWAGGTPQALAGAAATSSHKSGFRPPLQEFILSLDVVTPEGAVVRLEPDEGITDPERFRERYPDRTLIRNSELFYSSIILCRVGVVYAAIIQTVPRYWLKLSRVFYDNPNAAEIAMRDLLEAQERGEGPWQFEAWVMPRRMRIMLMIQEKELNEPKPIAKEPLDVFSFAVAVVKGVLLGILEEESTALGYHVLAYYFPALFETVLEALLESRGESGIYLEGRHYGGGGVPDLLMLATENVVRYEGSHSPFQWIHRIRAATNDCNFLSPLSIRFVGASKHALSMFKGAPTDRFMVVETIAPPNGGTGQRYFRAVDELFRKEGRPHWGLNNFLREQPGRVEQIYGDDLRRWWTTRNMLVGERPTLLRAPPPLSRELTFAGRYRVDIRARVLEGADTVSAWNFIQTHYTDLKRVKNGLPVPVRIARGDGKADVITLGAGAEQAWEWSDAPYSSVTWISKPEEFPHKAMKISVNGNECARVFRRMLYGQRVDRLLHLETGGGLFDTRPLTDLPVNQVALEISGEYLDPLQAVFHPGLGRTVAVLRGTDRHLHYYEPDGGSWRHMNETFSMAGPVRGGFGAVYSAERDGIEIVARAEDGGRIHHFFRGRTGRFGWTNEEFGAIDSAGGCVAVWNPVRQNRELFVAGADGLLCHGFYAEGRPATDRTSFARHGKIDGHLSAVYNVASGHAEVFLRDERGDLAVSIFADGLWIERVLVKGPIDGLLSAVHDPGTGFSAVFCRGTEGDLILVYERPGHERRRNWVAEKIPLDIGANGVMTATSGMKDARPSVFVRGRDGLLRHVYRDGEEWRSERDALVGAGRVESASAVHNPVTDSPEVVVRGEDGRVSHFHRVGGAWRRDTVTWLSP